MNQLSMTKKCAYMKILSTLMYFVSFKCDVFVVTQRPSLPAIPTFSEVPAPAKIFRQRRASRGALGSITERTFEGEC